MKRIYKILGLILAVSVAITAMAACGTSESSSSADTGEGSSNKLSVVTTIFPEYDWTMEVLGDQAENTEVTLLMQNGVDLHSYQPTASDILKISSADVFIYVGGESDAWVEDALASAQNKDMAVINLMEIMGDDVREEEVVEGMQEHEHEHEDAEEEEEHAEEEGEEHEHEETEYDEHVWLSLKNTPAFIRAISSALSEKDAANAETYQNNADTYINELNEIEAEYAEAVSGAKTKTLLFGDRFPFRYLTEEYGLDYYAAFPGCSAETEASFETVTFLANKVDELKLKYVMVIDGSDQLIANTIIQNTDTKDQKILALNSMQSVDSDDMENGVTYLSILKDNLAVLKEALQ